MDLNRSELELESIVRRISDLELDLQPDFQRGEIWDIRRRQRLIDSILRNWYIPAIHIVHTPEGGEIVLDGQQRLAAIRDFFKDIFKVDGLIEPHNENIKKLHGLRFSELPEGTRRSINRFALPVITLKEFEPQEPNELFFRLNQSYNLTPPEKRNALHGPARDQIKQLVAHLGEIGLLQRESIGFSNGRLAYDDIVARTCLAVERRDLSQHINNNVVEEFYRSDEFSRETMNGVAQAGQQLLELLPLCEDRVRFNKATLFTWLVYCFWRPALGGGPIPLDFLASFEADRARLKRGTTGDDLKDPIFGAVALYDDRASYRVTDVSSVLARDVVLQLYSEHRFNTPSIGGSEFLLKELRQGRRDQVQHLILDHIDETSWKIVLGMTRERESR